MKIKLLAIISIMSLGLLVGCTTTGTRCYPSNTNYYWQPCMSQTPCGTCVKNIYQPATCVQKTNCGCGCTTTPCAATQGYTE
jgi:hypothetical protein